jgi:hypothetical protein
VALVAVATRILLPIIKDNGGMELIAYPPMHISTIICVLLCLFLEKKVMSVHAGYSRPLLVGYALLMCFAIVGDALAVFIGAIPVCMMAMFSILDGRNRLSNWLILASTILAVIMAKVSDRCEFPHRRL